MPNTLCHIALQTPATKLLWRDSSFLLIVIACIIPDIPWILQRILLSADLFNPYDLRLYFSAQASYLFCLLAVAAIAAFSPRPKPVLAIGAWNTLLHLLLDASQIKWANAIHLFAPFSWKPIHYGMLWPEHIFWSLMTVLGACTILFFWLRKQTLRITCPTVTPARTAIGIIALLIYGLGPVFFLSSIEKSGMYSIQTLRNRDERTGKQVQFDRVPYDRVSGTIRTFAGEKLYLDKVVPEQTDTISIKGRFSSQERIEVTEYHAHSGFRDYASIAGLFMACALLLHSVLLSRKKF